MLHWEGTQMFWPEPNERFQETSSRISSLETLRGSIKNHFLAPKGSPEHWTTGQTSPQLGLPWKGILNGCAGTSLQRRWDGWGGAERLLQVLQRLNFVSHSSCPLAEPHEWPVSSRVVRKEQWWVRGQVQRSQEYAGKVAPTVVLLEGDVQSSPERGFQWDSHQGCKEDYGCEPPTWDSLPPILPGGTCQWADSGKPHMETVLMGRYEEAHGSMGVSNQGTGITEDRKKGGMNEIWASSRVGW